ncbi:MAG: enoyl-CoA hydratase/isomerase family protein [Phycisphaeraceae bacterium]|nr:MAG: enoyl-CoA hydratase/isomerase family protein [Phycisphaeraceae bacterium]
MTTSPLPIHFGAGEHAGINVIVLEQPGRPVVVLDHELIVRLEATLDMLPKDARGLVLASASDRSFVAGADLKSITALEDPHLHKYLEYGASVFGKIARLPYPTAAAINGAALGGGLELAMHCDGLIGAPSPSGKPYPVGLPEAGLSICPGWGGTNLLPARIEPGTAIAMTATGKTMKYDEAVGAGLFDLVCDDPAELRHVAATWVAEQAASTRRHRDDEPLVWVGRGEWAARTLEALDQTRPDLPKTRAAEAVADCVDAGLAQGWEAAIARERSHLVRLRHTPEATEAIEAFFAKSK